MHQMTVSTADGNEMQMYRCPARLQLVDVAVCLWEAGHTLWPTSLLVVNNFNRRIRRELSVFIFESFASLSFNNEDSTVAPVEGGR